LNQLNLKQVWLDINKQILAVMNLEFFDFVECAENKFLQNKIFSFMIKRKIRNDLNESIEQFLFNFDNSYCQDLIKLKKENSEILLKIENVLNQNQMLESYSNILSIFIQSYLVFASLVNEKTYSWKNFLYIIKSLLIKAIRDTQEQKYEIY